MGRMPKAPVILYSIVNMRMRDEGIDLDECCRRYDWDKEELLHRLSEAGFEYDLQTNRFR